MSVMRIWLAEALLAVVLLAVVLLAGLAAPALADDEPGEFDYYVLSLSWSPTYCETEGRDDRGPQCNGSRPYAFVLHGLWPQYDKGWPEFCDTGERPWVPRETIDAMLDIMPSPRLVIHQYRKHGTCSGLNVADYFAASRRAFASITIPERFTRPSTPLTVGPDEVVREFLGANSGLREDMLVVSCGARRLREVRICLSRELEPTSCGPNETERRLCRISRALMPPVRASATPRRYRY